MQKSNCVGVQSAEFSSVFLQSVLTFVPLREPGLSV